MNKKFIRNHWKPIIFSLSILIFLILVKMLMQDQIKVFDDAVYNLVSKLRCEPLTYFFKFMSFLCSTWFLFVVTVLIMIFSKNKKAAFYIGLNVILCVLLNQGFKYTFMRERPIDINLIIENGYSFPSGHSMVSLAFYGLFIYLIAHKKMKRNKKNIYCFALAVLTLLIGISRIYLGVHYASDVCAGFALAMAYLIIYILIVYKKMKKI